MKHYTLLFTISLGLLLNSCSTTAVFKTSEVVPAAEGTVKIKNGDNGKYIVKVNVNSLAAPDRLKPSRDCYVVWAESKEGTFNIGELKVDKFLVGSLEAESTYEPNRIVVSAEKDTKAVEPGKVIVLKTKKL